MSGAGPADSAGPAQPTEYRMAHLQERLAEDGIAELGVHVEMRGGTVLLTGAIPTAAHRDEIVRVAREELGGMPVRSDIVLTDAVAPDHPEELA